MTYTDAIKLLQEEIAKDPSKWQYPDVEFGTDLQTEHERWLCEKKVSGYTVTRNMRTTGQSMPKREGGLLLTC